MERRPRLRIAPRPDAPSAPVARLGGRPRWVSIAGLVAVAALAGCTQLTRSNPFAAEGLFSRIDSPAETTDDEPSPFRDSVPQDASSAAAEALAAEDSGPDGGADGGAIDGATEALIDAELATLPPEEQRQWREMFRSVEPAMIPAILEARRLKADDKPAVLADATKTDNTKTDDSATADAVADDSAEAKPKDAAGIRADFIRRRRRKEQDKAMAAAKTASDSRPADFDRTGPQQAEPAIIDATEPSDPKAVWPPRDEPAVLTESETAPSDGGSPIRPVAFEQEAAGPTQQTQRAVERLISELEREVAALPEAGSDEERAEQTKRRVFLRMLYLMNDQQARSLQAIPNLPAAHQEFWTQLFWGLTNYFDAESIPEPSHRASEAVAQLRAAARAMQSEARLELRNGSFTYAIEGFGNIKPYERDEFLPGEKVLAYLEVRNFTSEPTSEGWYRVRLKTTLEIHKSGPGGGLISSEPVRSEKPDLCRTVRSDYFHSYEVILPSDLTLGPHTLKLIVEDEISHRVATATLPFVVK